MVSNYFVPVKRKGIKDVQLGQTMYGQLNALDLVCLLDLHEIWDVLNKDYDRSHDEPQLISDVVYLFYF